MPHTLTQILANFRPPDTRHPGDWAGSNVKLGSWSPWPGMFSYNKSPWLRRIFSDFHRKTCHQQTIIGASSSGKSTVGLMCLPWIICNDPGFTVWYEPDEKAASDYSEEYIMPTLNACPAVVQLFPPSRHKVRDEAIVFPHMPFYVLPANIGNTQRIHVRYIFADEPWLYKPGIFSSMKKRLDAFRHNSKFMLMSTGADKDGETNQEFDKGTKREWCFRCPKCGKLFPPIWTPTEKDAPGGAHWSPEAKKSGGWDMEAVKDSCYQECPHCRERYEPNETNEYLLNRAGDYDGPGDSANESYHFNSQATKFTMMPKVAEEFLLAKAALKRGSVELQMDWVLKRMAGFWALKDVDAVEIVSGLGTYKMRDKWPDAEALIMTVDVQQREFWIVIRAWRKGDESRLVLAVNALTWEEVRKIQTDNKVQDIYVGVDSGHYTDQVYQQCCKYGWAAIKGEKALGGFMVRDNQGNQYQVPAIEALGKATPSALLPGSKENACDLIRISEMMTSDAMHIRRTGHCPNWTIPDDAPEFYRKQLSARVRRDREAKLTGQSITEWVTVGKQGEHCWDCERYQIGFAHLAGFMEPLPPVIEVEAKNA